MDEPISITTDRSSETEFHEELDELQIQFPGNKFIPFSDGTGLLQSFESQFPKWKDPGKTISIPVARIPKVFSHSSQRNKQLRNKSKATFKGEEAETKLYQMFVESCLNKEGGMIVLPNVDGSHIFKTECAKVELDMMLVHSKMGVFIFNVKNEGKGRTSPEKMWKSIEKHRNFIRMLINYKIKPDQSPAPIHTVVCDFGSKDKSKFAKLEKLSECVKDKVIVFNKSELDCTDFCEVWASKLKNANISDVQWDESMEDFVARLTALVSINGATALIYSKLQEGAQPDLESAIQNKDFQKVIVDCSESISQIKVLFCFL